MRARGWMWQAATICLGTALAGCGVGGSGDCAPGCSEKIACAMLGSNLTALAALQGGATVATKGLTGTPKWVGAIEGIQITHDGTPSQVPASQILGTSIYISGWVFKYCAGLDEVVYGAGPSTSSAEKGCQDFDCSQIADYAMPAVDSPAAIATAFPSDPAATLYKVDLNLLASGARVWAIAGPSATVNVDADTGMLVP